MDCLSASQLCCIKQDRELFEGLSLQVSAGEALHVVGDNGAGKTSLLRILAGLSQPQRGSVVWNQVDISEQPELYNTAVLYLGHKLALNGHLTARENLKFWCGLHQIEADTDFYVLLAHLGLTGLEDVPVVNLSAGQQRRVSLCRIWLKQAKLLILDEPFNALDVDSRALLENKLQQHVDGGGLLILTSHWQLPEVFHTRELRLEYNI
ncbi:cytochrome c biogenesis ATP-binding export protein CcmA [Planctobacterium marinum]|uniref:Cytochrome c biogenesis ATP-binding export protein CcmA n=1 Tax=Planctobacterium marinum TaxID=1631968 RepID=A0AA48I842_9ALTE|nr:cytochrome c biogenesis ATP-binding export protein CcmA [Planctobacterium marinum]